MCVSKKGDATTLKRSGFDFERGRSKLGGGGRSTTVCRFGENAVCFIIATEGMRQQI